MIEIRQVHQLQELPLATGDRALSFAAFENENIAGFITGLVYPLAKEAFLSCIQVFPEFQKKEIASKLVSHFVNDLQKKSISILNFNYTITPALAQLLEKTGFSPAELLTRTYYFQEPSFTPSWYLSSSSLPEDFTLLPWKELTSEDLLLIKSWVENNPSHYSPFDPNHPEDPITSLALRYKNQLAGWLVNHRLTPSLLRYSSFYAIPEIRGIGPSLIMLRESIRRHLDHDKTVIGAMQINHKLAPASWLRFVTHHLAPYAFKVEDIHYSYLLLDNRL